MLQRPDVRGFGARLVSGSRVPLDDHRSDATKAELNGQREPGRPRANDQYVGFRFVGCHAFPCLQRALSCFWVTNRTRSIAFSDP
jgi:hypothetical protein